MRVFQAGLPNPVERAGDRLGGDVQPRVTWATTFEDTFTAPYSGEYVVGAWGGGGNGSNNTNASAAASGGSGGLAVKRVFLLAGQTVTAKPGALPSVIFPDGSTMSAANGERALGSTPGAGGDASGGDLNLSGLSGSSTGADGKPGTGDVSVPGGKGVSGYAGGPSAPSAWPFIGGRGGKGETAADKVALTAVGNTPGGAAAACSGSSQNVGGKPMVRIFGY